MSEAIKALNNIRTLRAQARETYLATLEEMLENVLLSLKIEVMKKILPIKAYGSVYESLPDMKCSAFIEALIFGYITGSSQPNHVVHHII